MEGSSFRCHPKKDLKSNAAGNPDVFGVKLGSDSVKELSSLSCSFWALIALSKTSEIVSLPFTVGA